MSRYKFLRSHGCDPICAGFIAFFNRLHGYPANEIHFMFTVIEMQEQPHDN